MQYYTEEELLEVLDILMEDYDLSETEAFNILSEIKVSDETIEKLKKRNEERNQKALDEYDRTGNREILDKRIKTFEKNMERLEKKSDENFKEKRAEMDRQHSEARERERNNELNAARKREMDIKRKRRNIAVVGTAAALGTTAVVAHRLYKKHQAKKALKENSILMRENAKSITRK